MSPLLTAILTVGTLFLFVMSLRLGITGPGLLLILLAGLYLFYTTGYLRGKQKKMDDPDDYDDPSEPGPFG